MQILEPEQELQDIFVSRQIQWQVEWRAGDKKKHQQSQGGQGRMQNPTFQSQEIGDLLKWGRRNTHDSQGGEMIWLIIVITGETRETNHKGGKWKEKQSFKIKQDTI